MPTSAGVLFTRNPVTGADERVIEASWGLGEAVVAGLVTPDRYRLGAGRRELERSLGDKDIAIRPRAGRAAATDGGGAGRAADSSTSSASATPSSRPWTTWRRLRRVYGSTDHDIEFAFRGGELFLLQRRPITRG